MSIFNIAERRQRKADQLHAEGMALSDAGDDEAAIKKYLKAIELDPEKSVSLYNLGLIYKYRSEWEKSFDLNQRAYLISPDDESSRWNLAIAATALRRWDVARRMWVDQGIELEPGIGPIEMNLGRVPIRLNPEDDGEVVWATRIDPVRARIDSIPLPDSGFRHGDVVLHDGAAVGNRVVNEREYPVFNVLELFKQSKHGTFRASVEVASKDAIEQLHKAADRRGITVEDWTESIRILCRQCSEGTSHKHHDNDLDDGHWQLQRNIGIAANDAASVNELMQIWASQTSSRVSAIDCELEPL
ncbi:MAG TPA: tetratricopeptide repeat protein [Woeseiaceae bacterium]|nr:tetratricopeptide repeat protein [Woeseiaceae bacterium]